MKLKLLLRLALVLGGALLGFSTSASTNLNTITPRVAAVAKVEIKVAKVDSEETNSQDGYGQNAVDGNLKTYWHTQWHGNSPGLPHEIIIELIPPSVIKGFTYLPRQDESDHGTIKDYEFYISDDGMQFGQPVKKGTFEPGKEEKIETFEPVKCRFIKLKAISEINGLPWTSAAEICVIQSGEDASVKDYWRGNAGQTDWESTAPPPDDDRGRIAAFVRRRAADCDAVILSDYAKGLLCREIVEATSICPLVLADPKPQNVELLRGVTCVAPNAAEASTMTGISIVDDASLERAGVRLLEMLDCRYAVITRGEHGMALFGRNGQRLRIPSVARTVYDVSGAGDTVIAVLALALAAGAAIEQAMQLANFAAGVVVEKLGTATASPEEIVALVEPATASG